MPKKPIFYKPKSAEERRKKKQSKTQKKMHSNKKKKQRQSTEESLQGLTLLIDIDRTLLHCKKDIPDEFKQIAIDALPPRKPEPLNGPKPYYNDTNVYRLKPYGWVKFRPGVFTFLDSLRKSGVRMHLFTRARYEYALRMREMIEYRLGPTFQPRMFTREDFRDSKKHFPRDSSLSLDNTLVLDDNMNVLTPTLQPRCIQVTPFRYFGKPNRSSSSFRSVLSKLGTLLNIS